MGARMTTIEVEQSTADILKEKAEASGLSLDVYLQLLAKSESTARQSEISGAEIDAILDELANGSTGISPLPASFSREDIYFDHD